MLVRLENCVGCTTHFYEDKKYRLATLIEQRVMRMKISAFIAKDFYGLKGQIDLVRNRLNSMG
jgi:hypothetical protein